MANIFSFLFKNLEPRIDTSGEYWKSKEPDAIEEFLFAYTSDGYTTDEFRLAKCECGSIIFNLEADDNEGVAKRVCCKCNKEHYICDSKEYYDDAEPERYQCTICKQDQANIGVGFSLHDDGEVRWIYVGYRCVRCGILGCFAGWKVGYSPSKQLLERE